MSSIQAESRSHLLTLRPVGISVGLDQFLRSFLAINKFALAHMSATVGCPDLVVECAPLAIGVLVGAIGIHAGVKFAGGLDVGEFASLGFAVGSVAAERHAGVLEVTELVGAVGEESAHLLGLV